MSPLRALLDYRFLWKANRDEVRVFNWTGKNDYVALCEPESISFGGGYDTILFFPPSFPPPPLTCQCWRLTRCFINRDGHYGLYLDETLFEGSSARCPTFNNDPLCTSDSDKGGGDGGTATFECVGLEVWGVGVSS
jgi:TLD protein